MQPTKKTCQNTPKDFFRLRSSSQIALRSRGKCLRCVGQTDTCRARCVRASLTTTSSWGRNVSIYGQVVSWNANNVSSRQQAFKWLANRCGRSNIYLIQEVKGWPDGDQVDLPYDYKLLLVFFLIELHLDSMMHASALSRGRRPLFRHICLIRQTAG